MVGGWATYDAAFESKDENPIEVQNLPNQYDAEKSKCLSRLAIWNVIEAKRILKKGGAILANQETIKWLVDADIAFRV